MELIKKKTFERTQLALTPWRAQLRTLFHFYCSISGARSWVYSNDLNFYDVICFVARTKKKWIWVFLSRTCSVPLAFKGNFETILRILRAVGKNVRADKHHQYIPHRRIAFFALADWLVQK